MIRIRTAQAEIALQRAQIASIARRTTNTKAGATVGAISGALILGTFAVGMVNGYCQNPSGCGGDAVGAGLGFGVGGAAGGALLGALVGSLSSRWVPVGNKVSLRP